MPEQHFQPPRTTVPGARQTRRRNSRASTLILAATLLLAAAAVAAGQPSTVQRQLGNKYSPLERINKDNVTGLEQAWEYHTGEVDTSKASLVAFEDEPSLIAGNLIVCTISRRLIALDPATGEERWTFDPESTGVTKKCRGINAWVDEEAPENAHCRTRIFLGTADYRLFAISARDGKPCSGFGDDGEIRMESDKEELLPGEVAATSKPAVINGVVVVASVVLDNQRLDAPSGRILAFDARSGEPLWEFNPIPQSPDDPASATWPEDPSRFGGGNVWSSMAVDESLDLVYLPTTSPAVDYYGGSRPGNNEYADSVVALRGSTGEVVWHFQLVHHNIWDYEPPSQPLLIDYPRDGETVPALVQVSKTGMIFVFDRATGEPLVPIEERPVPQDGAVPGEWLSPTQPFSALPTVAPHGIGPEDAWGFTPLDRWACRDRIEALLYGPIYTPPSLQGTIFQPGPAGGPNWGGGSYDPESHLLVVPSNRVPFVLTLVPRGEIDLEPGQAMESRSTMLFPTEGSPYVTRIDPLLSPLGAPCTAPPWAALTAVDLVKQEIVWEAPLGTIENLAPVPIPLEMGAPGAGGALVTAGGLVFIGYSNDDKFRAFDVETGEVLWETKLPAAGTANPVTYEINGDQYLFLTAGGHSMYQTTMGDSVIAYRLKR